MKRWWHGWAAVSAVCLLCASPPSDGWATNGVVDVADVSSAAVRGTRSQATPPPEPPMICAGGSVVHRVDTHGVKLVALTFDDGPSPDNTERIMAALEAGNGRGTFFMIGGLARMYPTLAASVRARGHEVGNHTFNHYRDGYRISLEIGWAGELIGGIVGKTPRVFRSPGLVNTELVKKELARLGMCNIFGSIDPGDTMSPTRTADELCKVFKSNLHPGAIVMMHDGGARRPTAVAVPCMVQYALAQGYRLVTVSELLGQGYTTS